jgi:hypothetical protein
MKTIEDVMHEAAKAADIPNPLPESFKTADQAATYYRVLSQGYKAVWLDEAQQNTLLAQKCLDYAGQIQRLESLLEAETSRAEGWRKQYEAIKLNIAIQNRGDKDIPGVTVCDPNAEYCDKCNWQLIDTICPHCYPDLNFIVESL